MPIFVLSWSTMGGSMSDTGKRWQAVHRGPERSRMIRVVMDSTCGMTIEDFEKAGIVMAPLYIREGETLYRDGVDIKPAEFYKKEREGVIFESEQTNPDDLVRIFRPIVESRQSGYCQLMMGRLAKSLADEGKSRAQIVEALTELRDRTWVYFIMESLHWLYKGGRLTGAQALIGTIIQLKPIVWFDDLGRMVTHDKIRTIKAGKERLKELVLEMASYGVVSAGLHWADNWDEAKEFGDWMESVLHVPVEYNRVSCVVGCHVGPTVLGPVVVMKEKPKAKNRVD